MTSGYRFASDLLPSGQKGRGPCGAAAQPGPLFLQPAVEVTAPGDVKALQQVALV
jgi:hypothetical protein